MTITWYGHSCFKVANQGGHLTIVIDPFNKSIGLTPPRGNADIVLMSHQHPGHNNAASVSGDFFTVDGPGEYEIKGITITGINGYHDDMKGQKRGLNTIYLIEMDGIKVCHLGDFGQQSLTDSQLEAIGDMDVLMIPVGGQNSLDANKAVTLIEQLDPKLVIPMHYKLPNVGVKLDSVDVFLKEMGVSDKKTSEKLVLKKKDLTNKEMEVVVMKV